MHPDLIATIELVYNPSGCKYSQPQNEPEASEYGGYTFELNGKSIRFRVAKITPTKIGQFVTLWKRIGKGPIQPYDISDPVDFYVISVRQGKHFGQFVFPKDVLLSKGNKGGKRAMRVYAPWDKPTSKQAEKTQVWQVGYFLEISGDKKIDWERFGGLYDSRDGLSCK